MPTETIAIVFSFHHQVKKKIVLDIQTFDCKETFDSIAFKNKSLYTTCHTKIAFVPLSIVYYHNAS